MVSNGLGGAPASGEERVRKFYREVMDGHKLPSLPIVDKEQAHYGLDHTVMGYTLLSQWNMDPQLVQAALNHHSDVSDDASNQLAEMVAVADYLCDKCGPGFFTEPPLPLPKTLARYGLADDPANVEIVGQIQQAYRDEIALFNAT